MAGRETHNQPPVNWRWRHWRGSIHNSINFHSLQSKE